MNSKENNQNNEVPVTHPSKIKALAEDFKREAKSLKTFLYNKETREVLGRDGLSWAKVLGCYFVFYTMLASFFVGMFAVFVATLPMDRPRYYAEKSVMSTRNMINPGLGFRPQIDIEDDLIYFSGRNPSEVERLTRNLKIYLNKYYDQRNDTSNEIADCGEQDLEQLREMFRANKTHCAFDYRAMLRGTDCDPDADFGFDTSGPCVLIKLNRIYSWTPQPYDNVNEIHVNTSLVTQDMLDTNIVVKCDGEHGTDRDALEQANLTYYSINSAQLNVYKVGMLPFYYYPYLNQPDYKSPLVFVKFGKLPPFQLINIICRAFARNIDSNDKLNQRGMTLFQVFSPITQ